MNRNKKIPINRLSRFYDEDDFRLELDMAREVIEEDLNTVLVLFRIDRNRSSTDDVYGESDASDIRFLPPVELKAIISLEQAENKVYGNSGLRYQEYGNLTFQVLETHLNDKNVDIMYGDIIGYSDYEDNIKYFEVADDGKINSDNQHTHYGYKKYFRTVKCVTIDPNQFNGL
jgi:hypothetical protein